MAVAPAGAILQAMPETNIRIDGSNEPVDFNRDNVDLEIRHERRAGRGFTPNPLSRNACPSVPRSWSGGGLLDPAAVLETCR